MGSLFDVKSNRVAPSLLDAKVPANTYSIADSVSPYDGEFTKSLRRSASGAVASGLALRAAVEDLYNQEQAKETYTKARDIAQHSAQVNPAQVSTLRDVRPDNALAFVQSSMGEAVPSMGLALAGGVAGRTIAARVAPNLLKSAPMAAEIAGGSLGMFPQEAGETALTLANDPVAMANTTPSQRLGLSAAKGGVNAVLESVVPARLGNKVLGPGLVKVAKGDRLSHIGGEMLKSGRDEFATEAAQELTGTVAHMAANDAVKVDPWELANAGVKGLLPGAAFGGVGGVSDVARSALSSDPARAGETLGEKVGQAAGNFAADREQKKQRDVELPSHDADLLAFTRPVEDTLDPSSPTFSEDLQAADNARAEHAVNLAKRMLDPNSTIPDQYNDKELGAAAEFLANVDKDPVGSMQSFGETLYNSKAAKKADKRYERMSSGLLERMGANRKGNAQSVSTEGSLEQQGSDSQTINTIDKVMSVWQDRQPKALPIGRDDPRSQMLRRAVGQWVANGFADVDGKKFVPTAFIDELGPDAASSILDAHKLLKQQGVSKTSDEEAQSIVSKIEARTSGSQATRSFVLSSFTPAYRKSLGDNQAAADASLDVTRSLREWASGKAKLTDSTKSQLRDMFGASAPKVLSVFGRKKGVDELSAELGFDRPDQGAEDEANPTTFEEQDQIDSMRDFESSLPEFEPESRVAYHGPEKGFNTQHEQAQKDLAAKKAELSGANPNARYRVVGVHTAAKEQFAGDSNALKAAENKILSDNNWQGHPNERSKALSKLDRVRRVIREESVDEANRGEIKVKLKQVEKSTGRNDEYSLPEHGTIYLEHADPKNVDGDGVLAPKAVAVSAGKLLEAANTGSGVTSSEGAVAIQEKVRAAISALMNSDGKFTGRVGVKDKQGGEVRWLGAKDKLPASLDITSTVNEGSAEKQRAEASDDIKLGKAKEFKNENNTPVVDDFGSIVTQYKKPKRASERFDASELKDMTLTELRGAYLERQVALAAAQEIGKVPVINAVKRQLEAVEDEGAKRYGEAAWQRDGYDEKEGAIDRPSKPMQIADQDGQRAHTDDDRREVTTKLPKGVSAKAAASVLGQLRKGVPTFMSAYSALSAEKRDMASKALSAMIEAVSPDAPIWGGQPPKDMEAFGNRARLALTKINGGLKSVAGDEKYIRLANSVMNKKQLLEAQKVQNLQAIAETKGLSSVAKKSILEAAKRVPSEARQNAVKVDAKAEMKASTKLDLSKVNPKQPVWAVFTPANEDQAGDFVAAYADYTDANTAAEAGGYNIVNELAGKLRTESRASAQNTGNESMPSSEEQKAIRAELVKTLGDKIKTSFAKKIIGPNGEAWSGEWREMVIRISLQAGDMAGVARHESFHQLFSWMRQYGTPETQALLERQATNRIVMRQLETLLSDHPDAIKQLSDPEEAAAYMYQFWKAGQLRLGDETTGFFATVTKAFKAVVQHIAANVFGSHAAATAIKTRSEIEQAEEILNAFSDGQMAAEPDVVLQVLEKNVVVQKARLANSKGFFNKLAHNKFMDRAVYSAAGVLDDTNNPIFQAIARQFDVPEGEKFTKQGYFSSVNQERDTRLSELGKILKDVTPEEMKKATEYLQSRTDLKNIHAPRLKEIVRASRAYLDSMYEYMQRKGVKRWNDEKNDWEDIPAIRDNYFPVVFDLDKMTTKQAEFVKRLLDVHAAELEAIAAKANKERADGNDAGEYTASATIQGRDITPEDIAMAIYQRIVSSNGAKDIEETNSELGISPYAKAVNKRTLYWLDHSKFTEFLNDDLVQTMTSYTVQVIKRAEYTERFGPGGELLRASVDEALIHELGVDLNAAKADHAKAIKQWAKDKAAGGKDFDTPAPTLRQAAVSLLPKSERDVKLKEALSAIETPVKAIMAAEGTLGRDISPGTRKALSVAATYQNLRLLPLSLFSSFIDPLGIMVRGGTMQDAWDGFVRGIREIPKGWKGEASDDAMASLAAQLGVVDAGTYLDTLGQTYGSMFMHGSARKVNDKLFQINGMEAWNRAMRVQATAAAIGFIKRHLEKGGSQSERYLKDELGLDPAQRESFMKGTELDYDNPLVKSAIMRWVDGAILRPNAMQRPIVASDPHYMLFYQMKQFTYSFHRTILKRVINEAAHGNYTPVLSMVATYVPMMIAADVAKELLVPGDDPAWMRGGLGGYVRHGVSRAGLFGVPQMGFDALSHPAGIAGPTVDETVGWMLTPVTEAHNFPDEVVNAMPGAVILKRMHWADGAEN